MPEDEEKLYEKTIIVFTRVPWPDDTKTRLRPILSPEDCAEFQGCMLRDVLAQCRKTGLDVTVCYTSAERKAFLDPYLEGESVMLQQGSGLGERMGGAIEKTLERSDACVLVGSDLPFLTSGTLLEAFSLLEQYDAVFGPATDGGYYLAGMKAFRPEIFDVSGYGGSTVLRRTMQAVSDVGLSAGLCTLSHDLDVKEDLLRLAREISAGRLLCPASRRFLASRGFLTGL